MAGEQPWADLSAVDYKIWDITTSLPHNSGECKLKQRVIDVWAGVPQSVIDDVIDQCPRRLHACVRASGGHFEYSL